VDRNGKPIEVPGLVAETPDEVRRFQAAEQRRHVRLEERETERLKREAGRHGAR